MSEDHALRRAMSEDHAIRRAMSEDHAIRRAMRKDHALRRLAAACAAALLCCSCGDDIPSSSPPPEATVEPVWFSDVTTAWGLAFTHDSGASEERHLPETMGAGVAVSDFDEDGDLDLYFVQSGPFPPGASTPGGAAPPNELWLDEGASGAPRFVDRTGESGEAADTGYGMGVAAGDVDGGDGSGHFADITARAGLSEERWTVGATLFDADRDGDLDLYVTGYLDYDPGTAPWCGRREEGWRSYCHPDRFDGIPDRFWRNRGDGTFVDDTRAAGFGAVPASDPGKGLGAQACDFDDDGDLDLYVANDSTENRLWWNDGNGVFSDGTLLSGAGVNGDGLTEAGMGIAAGDVDDDGDFDLFVTNFDEESNTLYRNDGAGIFRDVTVEAGLEAPSRLPVGFGCALADFDLDGDLDLAVANGHILHNIALYHDGKSHAQRAQLFVREQGRYTDSPGIAGALGAVPRVGRGLVAADLDRDGDLDLIATECGGSSRLLRNEAPPRGESLTLVGLPRHARVTLEGADGRPLRVFEAGGAVSYACSGPDELLLARLPGARLRITLTDTERSTWSLELPTRGRHAFRELR